MSRFVKTLALFVAGIQLAHSKTSEVLIGPPITGDGDLKGVTLQPLNGRFDNLFAGHASHSSHRSHSSHSSHYSGSSGSASPYVAPATPAASPVKAAEKAPEVLAPEIIPNATSVSGGVEGGSIVPINSINPSTATTTSTTGRRVGATDSSVKPDMPMTLAEKLRLQIIRVQIRLNSLGLYDGEINGILDAQTRTALKYFQRVKSLPESGQMTTPTLNALGIPAVR